MTKIRMIASALGLLSVGGLASCNKPDKQTTKVPDSTGAAEPAKEDEECLHSEGCCGGHTEGDATCGAAKAEAQKAKQSAEEAKAGTPEVAATPQRFEWTVAPGKFAEINVELGDGAKMSASFESDSTVAWNVHSHPGDKPTIHAEGEDRKGAPAFTAEKGGLYSYLWFNKGKQAVKLVVELTIEGTGRVHSTHPE
jgi:hypothetical protein